MKHRVSVFAVLVLAFMTAATFALPDSSFAAGTQASPTAENVQYYTVNKDGKDVKTGIKSIVIDQNTYTNISRDADLNPPAGDGSVEPTIQLTDATMKKIAEKYVFPKWSAVAEGIFRDQANQLVTIEGSGMMTSAIDEKESFDRHFSYGRAGVNEQYGKYKWALRDLADTLGAPPSKSGKDATDVNEFKVLQGKVCDDEVVYSGIYPINNLSDARTLMGKGLRACSDDDDLTVDDFLGNKKDKSSGEYRLPALNDDKTGKGYCSIVTCVNRAGVSWDYDYNTFGIAVYDFDVTPIAAKNLDYITAAQDYLGQENPLKAAQKAGVKGVYYNSSASTVRSNYITNRSPQVSSNTVALAQNVTETLTSTTQKTFNFGMDESIGGEYRWGGSASKWSITAKFQMTFRESWATMKANAQSNSKQENRTITTQVSLPGHTAAAINQNIEEITQEEDYQQPVVINYKVAVFAMSGDYYNGSLGVGYISPGRYDKEWMSVIFDGSDSLDSNGCKALSSLYNRAVTNFSVDDYDGVRGKYRTWCDKGAWRESAKIDWTKVASDIKGDKRVSHNVLDNGAVLGSGDNAVAKMASNLQFAEAATTNHTDSNAMTTSVGEVVPLYDLKSVDIAKGNRSFDIKTTQGTTQKIYLNSIELKGYDKDEVEFYGFDTVKGKWKLWDADSNQEADAAQVDGISLTDDPVQGQTAEITPDTENNRTYTLKWVPDKTQKIITDQSQKGMTETAIGNIETPLIEINTKPVSSEIQTVNLTGEYTGAYNMPVNLNSVLNVNVTGSGGSALSVPVYWEGSMGINVKENGDASFDAPGEYRVRAYCFKNGAKVTSDWRTITATEKPMLKSISLDVSGIDENKLVLNDKNRSRSYDLSSFISYKDQFGNAWEGTKEEPLPDVKFSVNENDRDIAEIDEDGVLTLKKGGTYEVTATATDINGKTVSDSATIQVTEQPWLSTVEFNRPDVGKNDLILSGTGDQIKIGDLKALLDYYDQNGNEWTGTKPKVTFRILEDTEGAEITSGGNYSFYAYQPGRYTIQPEITGFEIEPVTIVVTEEPNLVIQVAPPVRQVLTGDEPIELELDRLLTGTTTFGATWKGDLPEMRFTLEGDVSGASIDVETVKDSRTEEDIEIHKFVCDKAGEYAVHVAPKQESAYAGSIDDIIINVVRYNKVARLGFEEIDGDLIVDTYKEEYPEIALEQYVRYYDSNGTEVDSARVNSIVPKIDFEIAQYEYDADNDKLIEQEVDPGDAALEDGVLKIYTGGIYLIRVTAAGQDDITAGETAVYAPDITWAHQFSGAWNVTKEPTCTEDGIKEKTCEDPQCSTCRHKGEGYHETITDVIPATEHKWNNMHEEITDDNGNRYAVITCAECGTERRSTRLTLEPDMEIMTDENTPATCKDYGTLVIRDKNSDERTQYYVPATGHHWSTEYVTDAEHAPGCHNAGTEWIECVDCGAVKPDSEQTVPALGDEYPVDEQTGEIIWDKEVAPTCETDGYREVKCRNCSAVWREPLPASGHQWAAEETVDKAPTCTEEGVKSVRCTVEGCDSVMTELIPATGHDFGKWTEVETLKCDDRGSEQRICNVCGYTETRNLNPKGHTWETEYTVDKKATCSEDGSESIHCHYCDAVYTSRTIRAGGHDWDSWEILAKPTCDSKGVRERICKTCSETQRVSSDVLGHDYKHVKVKAKVGVAGSEYDKCIRCGSVANKKTFKALKPAATKIKNLKAAKKGFTVKWAKKSYTGYQIRYSLKSSMASSKTVTIAKAGTVSKKVTKLKAKKKYYVQVRTYKTVKGKKYFSKWSAKKAVKTQ